MRTLNPQRDIFLPRRHVSTLTSEYARDERREYGDILRGIVLTGQSVYSPELVPSRSGDAHPPVMLLSSEQRAERDKQQAKRDAKKVTKAERMQQEYERLQLARQLAKEQLSQAEWEAEEKRRAVAQAEAEGLRQAALEAEAVVRIAAEVAAEDQRRAKAAEAEQRKQVEAEARKQAVGKAIAEGIAKAQAKAREAQDAVDTVQRRVTDRYNRIAEVPNERWAAVFLEHRSSAWLAEAIERGTALLAIRESPHDFDWADIRWPVIVTMAVEARERLPEAKVYLRRPHAKLFELIEQITEAEITRAFVTVEAINRADAVTSEELRLR